jgi:hypothetical protein
MRAGWLLALLAACTSARVPLGAPDAQGGFDVGGNLDARPLIDASAAADAITANDAEVGRDAVVIGNPCHNDCDCDYTLACLGGTCQIANRENLCCLSPFCAVGAQCEEPVCDCCPTDCARAGATCGPIGDGCGGLLMCGTCVAPDVCGGGGVPSQCGSPPDAGCVPLTCATLGANCGFTSDRCGGTIQCGNCNPPEFCGGGGKPLVCGTKPPSTCKSDAGPGD